ncbi:MAG: Ryanodine receptor Ryr [Ruminiclostridium sp.]|jgi:ryanodine receptor 2|nr:Ryanodine receptor Ryr [Ruminiclostridium sp.]
MYKPSPIDTSHIMLPEEIVGLMEKLAENTHEVWSSQRIKDGWTYGEIRDDAQKTHPCLVPYDDLPENEKEYDRVISANTLKMIYALGYEIRRKED